jgi:MFS family permease
LFESFLSFLRNLDSRFKVMLGAIGLHNWSLSLPAQYDQLYITALGANPIELGSLNAVGTAVNSIVSSPMGWAADKYGVKKVMTFGLALTIIAAGIYGLSANWLMIIPAIIITQIGMMLIMPLTDTIFIGTTSSKQRATAIGFSRALWAIPCSFVPMVAALIVVAFGGIGAQGIRPLYFIELTLELLVLLLVIVMLKPLLPSQPRKADAPAKNVGGSGLKEAGFIGDLRKLFEGETKLKRWLLIYSLRQVSTSMASPFVPLWVVTVKGADPYILGVMGTIGVITSVFLQIPVGSLADRIGRKKAFFLLHPMLALGTFLLILAPSPEYLAIVGLLGAFGLRVGLVGAGGIGSLGQTPYITMFWEMVPAEKRGRWIGTANMFNILSLPASILAGFMWQQGFMVWVLLFPLIVDVLFILPLFFTVPETLIQST